MVRFVKLGFDFWSLFLTRRQDNLIILKNTLIKVFCLCLSLLLRATKKFFKGSGKAIELQAVKQVTDRAIANPNTHFFFIILFFLFLLFIYIPTKKGADMISYSLFLSENLIQISLLFLASNKSKSAQYSKKSKCC